MNLAYSAEYEAFREEVRTFLRDNWTDEDKAAVPAADPQSVASAMGAGIRTDVLGDVVQAGAHDRLDLGGRVQWHGSGHGHADSG